MIDLMHSHSWVSTSHDRVMTVFNMIMLIDTSFDLKETKDFLILLNKSNQSPVFVYDKLNTRIGTSRNYIFVDCGLFDVIADQFGVDVHTMISQLSKNFADRTGMKKPQGKDNPAWLQYRMLLLFSPKSTLLQTNNIKAFLN